MLILNMAKVVGIDVLGHPDPLEFILLGGKRGIIPEDAFAHVRHDTHSPLLFRVHF